jgi:hypothetical protein
VAAKAVDHFDEARIGLTPAVRGLLTSDLDTPSGDLPSDLASAGESEAIQRLVGAVAQLEELIKNL